MSPPPRILCFGFGYCAAALAPALALAGFEIVGTSREPETRAAALGEASWTLHRFDAGTSPAEVEALLRGATHLLQSIAPGPEGDPLLHSHAPLVEAAIARGTLGWLGYLSTTGVYGDHGGAWVSEDSPRRPTQLRTRRRLRAEDRWLGLGAQVFRLAGIYGPGRSALERVESGRARRIIKADKPFNRIHVHDLAQVLLAAIERAGPQPLARAYNVSDGAPSSAAAPITYAAQLLGVEAPPELTLEAAELSPLARSFWRDKVRVDNSRITRELGVVLAYPDYRRGLRACLEARECPPSDA